MNIDVVREIFDEVVVVIRKNRLSYIATVLNTLIDDMEAHEDKVPYAFLSESLLGTTNQVKTMLYENTVPVEDYDDMDTTGSIVISYKDLGTLNTILVR